MATTSDRSLKAHNIKWLVLLALLDMTIVLLFIVPDLIKHSTLNQLVILRASATVVLPVAVLLLVSLFSHNIKATLVFWKLRNNMPGCEAFSRYGPSDLRIDMEILRKNVGEFPIDPAAQNKFWYKLYKKVEHELIVIEANRTYLMLRDMTAMSLLLIFLVPPGIALETRNPSVFWISLIFFVTQFAVCCLGARNCGVRLVCNVLALHSTKRITAAKSSKSQ